MIPLPTFGMFQYFCEPFEDNYSQYSLLCVMVMDLLSSCLDCPAMNSDDSFNYPTDNFVDIVNYSSSFDGDCRFGAVGVGRRCTILALLLIRGVMSPG